MKSLRDSDDPPPEPALGFLIFFLGISINGAAVTPIIVLACLLLCSALISGSEVAFFSLTPEDFKKIDEDGGKTKERIQKLRDKPRYLLATILIANNFINIAIVVLSESIIWNFFSQELFNSWAQALISLIGPDWVSVAAVSRGINFLITVFGITFLLVLFGETAPKIYARMNNIKFAQIMSFPLLIMSKLLSPFSEILVRMSGFVENKVSENSAGRTTSKEDLDKAIELTVNSEEDSKEEADILRGIVNFSEVAVKQIMQNRVDVLTIEFNTPFSQLLSVAKESGFSRIPVINEDFDNVTGILYVKDLLPFLEEGPNYEWQDLIRTDVFYAPESKKINELMKEFQDRRLHMSIVVDEYGGSSGIVTLEDIMEEIIGEIRDESDAVEDNDFIRLDDNNFIFDGKAHINDVCRAIEVDITTFEEFRGESDTVAGLILERSGVMPILEQEFVFDEKYKLKVVAISKRRIEKIHFTIL